MTKNLAFAIIAAALLAFAGACLAFGEDGFAIIAFVGAFFLVLEIGE
jgi:hypothetical protein